MGQSVFLTWNVTICNALFNPADLLYVSKGLAEYRWFEIYIIMPALFE